MVHFGGKFKWQPKRVAPKKRRAAQRALAEKNQAERKAKRDAKRA